MAGIGSDIQRTMKRARGKERSDKGGTHKHGGRSIHLQAWRTMKEGTKVGTSKERRAYNADQNNWF